MQDRSFCSTFTLALLLAPLACAHHHDVRPSADGNHTVLLQVERKNEGSSEAMAQARHYCEKIEHKIAYFVSDKVEYVGSMSEQNYNTSKTLADVGSSAGRIGTALSRDHKSRDASSGVFMGSDAIDSAIGSGYAYQMIFICK